MLHNSQPEVIFLLGAGASIPARISGVQGMVSKCISKLQADHRKSYLTTKQIYTLLLEWKIDQNQAVIDIELLLETIERLENRHLDVVPLFYNQKKKVLKTFQNLDKAKPKLSNIVKQFIKSETGKPDIQVDYLNGLLKFMKGHMPLHVFSTNYDICIERFCITNNKTFFDGFFDGEWDPDKFADNLNRDLLLYKLHGSVTWSRDERGRYARNETAITDTEQPQTNIVTGEKEIPLISYPGRKLEYFEPTFDLIVELKNRLNHPNLKYIFVVGYSFRDDHIRRLVQYASERNHEFILFLIGPSAHEIYQSNLKHYKDIDFVSGLEGNAEFTERNSNVTRNSSLIGRVIRLPYNFEKIVDVLHDTYLQQLRKGIEQENVENNKDKFEVVRWQECLEPYSQCEYFEKIEEIIKEKMGGWDRLMKSDYDIYKLGWKIIVKSLLNMFFLNQGRCEWLEKFKKYFADLVNGIEVDIEDSRLTFKFKYSEERGSMYADDIYNLFKGICNIYNNHPIFARKGVDQEIAKTGLQIPNICQYFSKLEKNFIFINDYISQMEGLYEENLTIVKKFAKNGSICRDRVISAVREIEKNELLKLIPSLVETQC